MMIVVLLLLLLLSRIHRGFLASSAADGGFPHFAPWESPPKKLFFIFFANVPFVHVCSYERSLFTSELQSLQPNKNIPALMLARKKAFNGGIQAYFCSPQHYRRRRVCFGQIAYEEKGSTDTNTGRVLRTAREKPQGHVRPEKSAHKTPIISPPHAGWEKHKLH